MSKTGDLQKELTRVYHIWRKRSSADKYGKVKCITCGTEFFWEEIDAGHFIPIKWLGTRYYDKNVHPQCILCNRFYGGKDKEYREALIEIYGEGIIEELNHLKHKTIKNYPYEEEIEKYKQLIKEL